MESNCGYLVYRSESMKREIKNHPKLLSIITHLNTEYSSYKFTVYRCAAKLYELQKSLYTSTIPYKVVLSVLERHRLNQADETITVRPAQLTPIIHDIFFACDRFGYFSEFTAFDLEIATAVLANFFWNVFDPNRTSPITLLEVKETFLVLCQVNCLDELISEFFLLAADHNKCISRFRFESLLKVLAKILSYIGESGSYGAYTIPNIVEQSFVQCLGMNGINEYQFNCLWNTTNTRFLIYANLLSLVKRIKDTEKLVYNSSCAACHVQKIIGIRFKCYTCRELSLCMKCFSIGYSSAKHSIGHRIYEVFSDDVPSKKWSHYITKLCNILFRKNSKNEGNKSDTESRTTYDHSVEDRGRQIEKAEVSNLVTKGTQCSTITESFEASDLDGNLLEKLTNIISTLFEQKLKIEKRKHGLERSSSRSKSIYDLLKDQENTLLVVIDQLKFIMEKSKQSMIPISSTPNRYNHRKVSIDTSSPLSRSIHGADINRSYLEANKSDYSLADVSTWFHNKNTQRRVQQMQPLNVINENTDTDMLNFRDLLSKVKEIVDDSYSDNNELAEATYHLETVLDSIIRDEERKRNVC